MLTLLHLPAALSVLRTFGRSSGGVCYLTEVYFAFPE
jgi:hypothetical protein